MAEEQQPATEAQSSQGGQQAGLTYLDISDEAFRTYAFPTGVVQIINPVKLHVKRKPEGDSHRIIDANGVCHYVPAGWLLISFKSTKGDGFQS